MNGTCKLCKKDKELVKSHTIPKFVLTWMKKTGSTFLRHASTPNSRKQDLHKEYLLCKGCEQLFSSSEKWFSENIFKKYLNENINVFHYDVNLSIFIISILWRLLVIEKERLSEEVKISNINLEKFELEWRQYLLGNLDSKNFTKIHLWLVPEKWGNNGIQPNQYVMHYFSRTIDGGIIDDEDNYILFVKFSRFIIFNELKSNRLNFRGTEVNFKNGILTYGYINNSNIGWYFVNRAESIHKYFDKNISKTQKDKIFENAIKNPDKLINSKLGEIILKDNFSSIDPNFKYKFSYTCDCCSKQIEEPEGFLLRTFEIIKSNLYWQRNFSQSNFGIDKKGLANRVENFQYISSFDTPWVICDSCIDIFEIDKKEAKTFMKIWIDKSGEYMPPKHKNFKQHISETEFNKIATMIVSIK